MNLSLSNLNVVVVGGTKGIGLAIAKGFLREKAHVHVISRTVNERLNEEFCTHKATFYPYIADATNEESLAKTLIQILANSGNKIDIVISTVGSGKGTQMPLSDSPDWERSWFTNFNSALNVSRVFTPELFKTKGSLIFISSIAGMEFIGAPTDYSTAKAALIAFSKSLSHRLAPNVRVNVVSPGNIMVKYGTWDLKMKENSVKVLEMLNEKVPLKRFGLPEEVCDLVLFLSSPRAAFITGGCFVIDGGQTIGF